MKKILLYGLAVALLTNCTKKHDTLVGTVNVSGQVLDGVSQQPIPHAIVYLYDVEMQTVGFGREPVRTNIAEVDTADAAGHYEFKVHAGGQYEFEAEAEPFHPSYVSSRLSTGINCRVNSLGQNKLDLECSRSAYARLQLRNTGKRDTVYAISFSGSVDYIQINNCYKDTTVYFKMPGGSAAPCNIRFVINDLKIDQNLQVKAAPWDTVSLQLQY